MLVPVLMFFGVNTCEGREKQNDIRWENKQLKWAYFTWKNRERVKAHRDKDYNILIRSILCLSYCCRWLNELSGWSRVSQKEKKDRLLLRNVNEREKKIEFEWNNVSEEIKVLNSSDSPSRCLNYSQSVADRFHQEWEIT